MFVCAYNKLMGCCASKTNMSGFIVYFQRMLCKKKEEEEEERIVESVRCN